MAGKQLQFPDNQTHDKRFEMAMIGFSILCIIITIIAISAVSGGTF